MEEVEEETAAIEAEKRFRNTIINKRSLQYNEKWWKNFSATLCLY
ncbi:MAG: hypothetical protein ACFFAT_21030 [Promethearchaeota archaeon]